ncbi:MAG: universal stress protein [Chloroflexi bacterium]|nr:universal stress protein [Chloroflexota bacterium]
MPATKILVPVNGSKASHEAVRVACMLAKRAKAKLHVIYVIQVRRTLPLDAEINAEVQRGEEVLSQVEQLAEEADYDVETELLQAREVGSAIVDAAVAQGVDLIIMGLGYKKRFGEFDLGSTIPYVLKNAPCQVWVCRQAIPVETPS